MSEINKKRIIFPPGEQKLFLESVQAKLQFDNETAADFLGICERTFRDWKREKFNIDSISANMLIEKSRIPLPHEVEIRDQFWYVHKGASLGGKARMKKYGNVGGDPVYRMNKWREWWKSNSHTVRQGLSHPKDVTLPNPSEKLAEFFGIMMGDGGMTKNQINISLHAYDDLEFAHYV
ncbi:MAG TPA: hypothetical protein VEA59_06615 [Patescibacteria group bacterium]|nr:hypothetical protein [Patescibacteria group bacterium]